VRGAELTAPVVYLFGSQNNRVTGNVGKTDITAGSLEAMELDATSTGNTLYDNDVATAEWDDDTNTAYHNTIGGELRGAQVSYAEQLLWRMPSA
jgi:hypothetical protein